MGENFEKNLNGGKKEPTEKDANKIGMRIGAGMLVGLAGGAAIEHERMTKNFKTEAKQAAVQAEITKRDTENLRYKEYMNSWVGQLVLFSERAGVTPDQLGKEVSSAVDQYVSDSVYITGDEELDMSKDELKRPERDALQSIREMVGARPEVNVVLRALIITEVSKREQALKGSA